MNEALRATGRTTRLIDRAVQEASTGRAVYFFVAMPSMIKLMEAAIQRAWEAYTGGRKSHGIKVEAMSSWDNKGQWNWEEMEPMYSGAHPNCLWLVDHFAVEGEISRIHHRIEQLAKLAGKLYPHTV